MAAHSTQAELAPNRPDGMRARRSIDQIGEDSFDDGVAAVGDVGIGDRFGVVGDERVIPPEGKPGSPRL
jgi:hypothetical protein